MSLAVGFRDADALGVLHLEGTVFGGCGHPVIDLEGALVALASATGKRDEFDLVFDVGVGVLTGVVCLSRRQDGVRGGSAQDAAHWVCESGLSKRIVSETRGPGEGRGCSSETEREDDELACHVKPLKCFRYQNLITGYWLTMGLQVEFTDTNDRWRKPCGKLNVVEASRGEIEGVNTAVRALWLRLWARKW
jgi:hypothetical protein